MTLRTLPYRRILLVLGLVLAADGFLSIHSYAPQFSLIANVMHARIYFEPVCTDFASPDTWGFRGVYKPGLCGASIAYRWVLAFGVTLIALSFLVRPTNAGPSAKDQAG